MIESSKVSHIELMESLSKKHLPLLDLIGDNPIHFVDIPVHGNIGDLLIMHGTLAFIRKHQIKTKCCAPAFAYNTDWVKPGEVIVFHGGGNFGDLYSEYGMQPLRELVVSRCKENRIIVLPQSIFFSSALERQQSVNIFRAHSDVHICVRDMRSYEIALEFSDHVYLMPDMAHQLYPISSLHPISGLGKLMISRVDGEKKVQLDASGLGIDAVTDWPELVGSREDYIERFRHAMRTAHKLGFGWLCNKKLSSLWTDYAGKLTDSATQLYSSHEVIITDRLHGHILACLMNKPSVVFDNTYGKNSAYVNAWTGGSELVSFT